MHTEEVSVKHTLTDNEIAMMARDQSNALQDRKALEDELVSVKKDYASRQAMADARVSRIAGLIQVGFEFRNVRCMLLDERLEGYRLTLRMDNGHCHRRRKLEQHERQTTITADQPREFTASALIPVDDEQWGIEIVQIGLYEDEFEALKTCQDIKFLPPPKATRKLSDGKETKKK